jgi:mitogen-activated protein kinase kinase kinase
MNSVIRRSTCAGLKDVCEMGSVKSSTIYRDNLSRSRSYWGAANFDDDMCLIDDKDDFAVSASTRFKSTLASADLNKVMNTSLSNYAFQELVLSLMTELFL